MSDHTVSARDQALLDATDVTPVSWEEAADIIKSGDLRRFRRSPQEIGRYLEAKKYFAEHYGGTAEFVLKERLGWNDQLEPVGSQFLDNAKDVKILPNDFPYLLDENISHVIIWSKLRGATDPESQQFVPEIAERIETFINLTFPRLGVKRQDIQWFKNTVALQSIPTLEHFHILIKNSPDLKPLYGTAGGLQ